MLLTRKQIINDNTPLAYEDVSCALGTARISELTAHDWSQYQNGMRVSGDLDLEDTNSILVCWCLIDEDGKRLFDPHNPDDIYFLSRKGSTFINKLFVVAQAINRVNELKITKKNS